MYLRLLPILTTRLSHSPSSSLGISHFSRPTSLAITTTSSSSTFRTQPFPHISTPVPLSPALIFSENVPPIVSSPPVLVPVTKENDKSSMRQIISAADIDLITRNAEDILKFQEQLVHELRELVTPLGFPMILDGADTGMQNQRMNSLETLDSALDAVSMKFIERVGVLRSSKCHSTESPSGAWF